MSILRENKLHTILKHSNEFKQLFFAYFCIKQNWSYSHSSFLCVCGGGGEVFTILQFSLIIFKEIKLIMRN